MDKPATAKINDRITLVRVDRGDRNATMVYFTQVVALLLDLRRGGCWCERGTGNPMAKTHSAICSEIQQIMKGAGISEHR